MAWVKRRLENSLNEESAISNGLRNSRFGPYVLDALLRILPDENLVSICDCDGAGAGRCSDIDSAGVESAARCFLIGGSNKNSVLLARFGDRSFVGQISGAAPCAR